MKMIVRKLKNRIGTSMVEMLATVVLLGIMGVALATGVATIQRTYNRIVRKANEQTLLSTTLIEMRNAIRKSVDYDDSGLFKSEEGYWFSFRNATGSEKGIYIDFFMEKDGSRVKTLPVVSEYDGKISDVYSSFGEGGGITPSGTDGIFEIKYLQVGNGTDPATVLDSYKIRQIVKREE